MNGQSPLDTRLASLGLILGALAVGYYYLSFQSPTYRSTTPPVKDITPGTLPPSAYHVPDSTIVPGNGIPPYVPTVIVPRSAP